MKNFLLVALATILLSATSVAGAGTVASFQLSPQGCQVIAQHVYAARTGVEQGMSPKNAVRPLQEMLDKLVEQAPDRDVALQTHKAIVQLVTELAVDKEYFKSPEEAASTFQGACFNSQGAFEIEIKE